MRKLTVRNFSVIKEAELEFGKITVLIGPQASGKSLLCKLAYFLSRESIMIAEGRISAGSDFSAFEKAVKKEFEEWFPRSGWGKQSWTISFESESYKVTAFWGGNPTEELSVSFCEEFRTVYSESQTYTYPDSQFWPAYRLRGLAGQGVWDRTTYIPSERTYFVDTSKDYKPLVSDPEPIVKEFALLYSNARDPKASRPRMQRYLGGMLEQGEDEWHFAFEDGRVVSLGKLSSGSKELLPLFCVLEMYEQQRPSTKAQINSGIASEDSYRTDDFYIEEPEGHIFPETQREIVQYFAELANSTALNTRITITTHSPYILSAFNNLLQAWQVGATGSDQVRKEVAGVIDEHYWIDPKDFRAYSIHNGKLESIMDKETHLINGAYLDSVSNDIGSQFDELLRIGYAKAQ